MGLWPVGTFQLQWTQVLFLGVSSVCSYLISPQISGFFTPYFLYTSTWWDYDKAPHFIWRVPVALVVRALHEFAAHQWIMISALGILLHGVFRVRK